MLLSSNIFKLNNEFGIKKTLDMFSEAGFKGVDFGLDLPMYKAEDNKDVFTDIKKYAENKGIGIYQTHAPFGYKVESEIENNYFFPEIVKSLEKS